MKFNCTKCGLCCMNLGRAIAHFKTITHRPLNPTEEAFLKFPYGVKADGSTCEKYEPGIGCTVYENRPDCCNIEKMKKDACAHYKWTEQEYYQEMAWSCNYQMIINQAPKQFFIPPGKEVV